MREKPSKLNKPVKRDIQRYCEQFGFCHKNTNEAREYNTAIDRMDAYYKQFIKDNIPSKAKLIQTVLDNVIQINTAPERYYIDRKEVAKAIHKLIKERLQVWLN